MLLEYFRVEYFVASRVKYSSILLLDTALDKIDRKQKMELIEKIDDDAMGTLIDFSKVCKKVTRQNSH